MPGASYPKPDGQTVTRHERAFDWVELPEKRVGKAPALPTWRKFDRRTRAWWSELWKRPQAVQWQQSGASLFALAVLYDDLITGRVDAAKLSAEIRQHEDRHGLSPKALLQLRWRLPEKAGASQATKAPASSSRKARLQVVA